MRSRRDGSEPLKQQFCPVLPQAPDFLQLRLKVGGYALEILTLVDDEQHGPGLGKLQKIGHRLSKRGERWRKLDRKLLGETRSNQPREIAF